MNLSDDRIRNICQTCLSATRKLSLASEFIALLIELKLFTRQSMRSLQEFWVCWECEGQLRRIHRFRRRAQRAQNELRRCLLSKNTAKQTLKCLSSLISTTKSTYDSHCSANDETTIFVPTNSSYANRVDVSAKDEFCDAFVNLSPLNDYTQCPEVEGASLENNINDSLNLLSREASGENGIEETDSLSVKDEPVEDCDVLSARFKAPKRSRTLDSRRSKKKVVMGSDRFRRLVVSADEMWRFREDERNCTRYQKAPYKCESCVVGYYKENHLKDHNADYHHKSVGELSCDICLVRYSSKSQLAGHCAAHFTRYQCMLCGFSHRLLKNLTRHYDNKHEPDKVYSCNACPAVFQTDRALRYHRECSHKALLRCEHCNKGFSNRGNLNRHLLLHTGMPMVACELCHKSYRGEAGLRAHMRTHGSRAPPGDAYCAECDVHFKHVYVYRQHLKSSSKHVTQDQLRFRCSACDKRFQLPSYLKRHYDAVHLKSTEFVCTTCHKSYSNAQVLRTHIRSVHERVPPPKNKVCDICARRFATKATLQSHIRTHTGERPFHCGACPATFGHSAALYTHNKLVHLKLKRGDKITHTDTQTNTEARLPR